MLVAECSNARRSFEGEDGENSLGWRTSARWEMLRERGTSLGWGVIYL